MRVSERDLRQSLPPVGQVDVRQLPADQVCVRVADCVSGAEPKLAETVLAPADQRVRGAVVHDGAGVVPSHCDRCRVPVAKSDRLDVVAHLEVTVALGTGIRGPRAAAELLVLAPALHRGVIDQGAREVLPEGDVTEGQAHADVGEEEVSTHLLFLIAVVRGVLVPCLAVGAVAPALHLAIRADDAGVRLAEFDGCHSRVVGIVALRQGLELLRGVVAGREKDELGAREQQQDQDEGPHGGYGFRSHAPHSSILAFDDIPERSIIFHLDTP